MGRPGPERTKFRAVDTAVMLANIVLNMRPAVIWETTPFPLIDSTQNQ